MSQFTSRAELLSYLNQIQLERGKKRQRKNLPEVRKYRQMRGKMLRSGPRIPFLVQNKKNKSSLNGELIIIALLAQW